MGTIRTAWRAARGWHAPLAWFGAAMLILLPLTAVGVLIDDRTVGGAPVWLKPGKFAASFVLYSFTTAWLVSRLRRHRRLAAVAGTIIAAASAIEMVVIVGQAARGQASHFNNTTPLDGMLFSVMGATIAVLWLANLALVVLLLRERSLDRPLATALRLGLGVALAGMALGFLMLGPTPAQGAALDRGEPTFVGGHSVGVPDGGPGLPVTGWSTTGGDLRVPHFVGMHALQVLPLLGVALGRIGSRWGVDEVTRVRLLRVAAVSYAALIALLTWQALRGQALIAPDGVMLGAAAALVLSTAALGGAVLVPAIQHRAAAPRFGAPS
jgi:hypothetical protein